MLNYRQEYYGEMPWLALPYSDRDRKAQLSSKFKVTGIPTLIILDENASVCVMYNSRLYLLRRVNNFILYNSRLYLLRRVNNFIL